MGCVASATLSAGAFLQKVNQDAVEQRIPVSGGMDLTERCNLDCIHCYLPRDRTKQNDLSTAQVLSIVDQVVDAGCLFFLLTGGEPLFREDFEQIYRHARKKGLLVSVFTNGTLVDNEIASLFEDVSPSSVEISIYGATSETHDAVTGVSGSFDAAMKGLSLLLDRGVNVSLKTMLMKLNLSEFDMMVDLAEARGVKFRMDAALFPRLDGDRSPLDLRVSPQVAVEKEFSVKGRASDWLDFTKRMGELPDSEELYECSAGTSYFHITANGILQPCVMTAEPSYDLKKGTFEEGWRTVMPALHEGKVDEGFACQSCDRKVLCDCCPSFFKLEEGHEQTFSEYICDIAMQRENLLQT